MNQVFAPYRDKSLDDFELISDEYTDVQAKIAEYIKDLDHARETGYGLTLIGPNGVGKTLLASVVLNEALSRGYRIEAIELSAYVGLYKEKFDLSSLIKAGCADDMIDSYVKVKHHIRYIRGHAKRSADFVLFDDVGREYESESGWSAQEFFDTLRFRWDRGLPTLLTANTFLAELDQRYTEGLSSLLMESSEVIVIDGDDYRWRKAS